MAAQEKILVGMLRLGACLMGSAIVAVFLPTEAMATIHRALGLGDYPAAPLTEYLTRSISCLYAIHGGLLAVLSTDVRRFATVVRYLAWSNLVFGILVTGIDLDAGLPTYWVAMEGPPVAGLGLLMLYLLRSVPAEAGRGA